MSERIWYEDLPNFLTNQNYYKIIPSQSMTIEEKLNAIVRFFTFLGIVLAVLKSDYKYLFFGIVASLFAIVLYEHQRVKRKESEKFLLENQIDIVDNRVCARSTVDNPFMNPNLTDIHRDDKPAACPIDNEKVQQDIEKNFEARLFRDVSDLYGNMSSQRQFYTVPQHDQGSFASWLYARGPTCKEGSGLQCSRNMLEDVHRRPGQPSGA
jgi:hypothetical protein